MRKKIIVSVTNDIYTDQRVRKVCEFLVDNDFEVILCGRKLKNSLPLPHTKYKTKRFKLPFTKGALFYATYNFRLFLYLFFHKADVLLANDLDTLLANYWAKKFKRKTLLMYDSHEYFCGVPELIERPKIQKIWRRIEKKIIPKVHEFYTVNESIANLYRKEYSREVKVVRNISDFKPLSNILSRGELGLPENKKIVIFQGAGINIQRGAEEAIEAIKLVENAVLCFVGDGDVIPELKKEVALKKLENKVLFFGKQSYDTLMNYTIHADVGLSLDKDTNINYRFSLPNKVFDYIHAQTPLLVSNLPEIKNIVENFEVGLVCPSHQPEEIADYINKIVTDLALQNKFKENCKKASEVLTWKNECEVLKEIYLKD